MSNTNWKCYETKADINDSEDTQNPAAMIVKRIYGHVPKHIPNKQIERYIKEKYDSKTSKKILEIAATTIYCDEGE